MGEAGDLQASGIHLKPRRWGFSFWPANSTRSGQTHRKCCTKQPEVVYSYSLRSIHGGFNGNPEIVDIHDVAPARRKSDFGSPAAGHRTSGRTEATGRRSELQTDHSHIGQERRRENRRRNAASRDTVVAHDGKWDVRVLCSPQPKDFESEKGKAGIAMASLEKLPALIDTLITAVRNDELDKQLAHAAKSGQVRKAKKAA